MNFGETIADGLSLRNSSFEYPSLSHATSFTSIKKTTTGTQITYDSGRSSTTGHADVAWSIMLAIDKEDITAALPVDETLGQTSKSFIEEC